MSDHGQSHQLTTKIMSVTQLNLFNDSRQHLHHLAPCLYFSRCWNIL